MIEKNVSYSLFCDNCKMMFMSSFDEFTSWVDESDAVENAKNDNWIEHRGKHYCPNCYKVNGDDNIVIEKWK